MIVEIIIKRDNGNVIYRAEGNAFMPLMFGCDPATGPVIDNGSQWWGFQCLPFLSFAEMVNTIALHEPEPLPSALNTSIPENDCFPAELEP